MVDVPIFGKLGLLRTLRNWIETMEPPRQPETVEVSPGLIGYAVLRANFNYSAPSYIENFSSFVFDVLAQAKPQYLRESEIADRVRSTFGLTIPDRVVGSLLKRGVQRGLVNPIQDRFCLADEALPAVRDLTGEMARFGREQKELLSKFAEFVERESPAHADEYTTAGLARHLQDFIEQNAVPLLATAVRTGASGPWADQSRAHGAPDFLVAAFLQHLLEYDGVAFGYVVDSVKGAMLAAVLELDTGNLSQKLNRVQLLLDTPVVLKLLGYQGEVQQRAVQQMVDLALSLKATVACFEHTVQEVDGVLDSVQAALRSRGRREGTLREVDAYFLDAGIEPADIELYRVHLTSNLQSRRVVVMTKPDTYLRYGLDEMKLEELLRSSLPGQRDSTRRYDVDSLSAIHRLRRGSSSNDFLQCGSVLITSNDQLARTSRRVDERHGWPLAMTDSELATILWVRSPAIAEDLPRQQLIATAYAGLQPSAHLWSKYLLEVEALQDAGGVSEDEALILRARPEARRALMDATLGQDEELTSDIVLGVVERVRTDIAAPFQHAVASANEARDQATAEARAQAEQLEESEARLAATDERLSSLADRLTHTETQLASMRQREASRRARVRAQARRHAKIAVRAVLVILTLVLCSAAVIDFTHPKWVAKMPTWLGIIILIAGIGLAVLTVLGLIVGGSVQQWLRPVELAIGARLSRRRLRHDADSNPDQLGA